VLPWPKISQPGYKPRHRYVHNAHHHTNHTRGRIHYLLIPPASKEREKERERVREREHGSRVRFRFRVRVRIIINNSTRHVDGLGTPLFYV